MTQALTLPMLSVMALTELRRIATVRLEQPGVGPVFLAPVHTEPFWRVDARHPEMRRASVGFRLVDMRHLFDHPVHYPLLERLEAHLRAALWVLVHHLLIVDGSRFVSLPYAGIGPPVFTAQDHDVAVLLHLDSVRQQLWLSAAVTSPLPVAIKDKGHECTISSPAGRTTPGSGSASRVRSVGPDGTTSP